MRKNDAACHWQMVKREHAIKGARCWIWNKTSSHRCQAKQKLVLAVVVGTSMIISDGMMLYPKSFSSQLLFICVICGVLALALEVLQRRSMNPKRTTNNEQNTNKKKTLSYLTPTVPICQTWCTHGTVGDDIEITQRSNSIPETFPSRCLLIVVDVNSMQRRPEYISIFTK